MDIYKKLISYVPEKKYLLFLVIVFSIFLTISQIMAFYYLYIFLEDLIISNKSDNILNSALKIVILLFLGACCYFVSLSLSHIFAFRLETNLRKYGISGLTSASFRFFDTNSSGKTRKLLDDNAAQTHMAVAHLIPDNVGSLLMPILVIVLGFIVSLRVGIILFFLVIIGMWLFKLMTGEEKFLHGYQESLERLSSETVEYIRGMQVVKIFGVDVRSFKNLNLAIKQYANYALNYSLSCRRPFVLFQEIFLALIVIIMPFAVYIFIPNTNKQSIIVELIMLFFLSGVLFTYIMKVMYLSMYLFRAKDAVTKLEYLYNEMKKDSLDFGIENNFTNFDIEFIDVTFSYGERIVLKDLSFKLEAGKSYALVGSSGSGKTTIAKLISGFYKIDSGTINVGGKPLTTYSKEAIIKNIAFVFQDPKLFKKSIYDNVSMANPNATSEEVFHALSLAGCDSILEKFPERENTIIGSKGVYLSGGEKQRLAIARAILKNANIVIFDEASAAIDPENEHELQKAFANLMKDKTVIMIAHRLTTIKNLDEIILLEDGMICERGTDAELMAIDSKYKKFQKLYLLANDWRIVDE